ncbi:hypothetical protein GCM10020221_16710 [Streptomyces thioluteus]|uniref:Uncharacterized protein n=1 Tax=Streptomyces thioluteus TaxID=66431 RepID=A0ABP6J4T0_STRTU
MGDLVGEGRPDVPAVALEARVELDEVLGPGGEFDAARVPHLVEADDHPRVRQPQVPHDRPGDALDAEVGVLVVGEGDVRRGDAQDEVAHAVGGEAPVQRGDRGAHRRQVRESVLDLDARAHRPPPPRSRARPLHSTGPPRARSSRPNGPYTLAGTVLVAGTVRSDTRTAPTRALA